MRSRESRVDTGVGVSFIASAVIHLTVFLLLVWWGQLYPPHMAVQETYYVDVVTLPTIVPPSGASAQKPGETTPEPPAVPVLPMPLPSPPSTAPKPVAKSVVKSAVKSAFDGAKPPSPLESPETESAFNERITRLEKNTEARREEAVLERLRTKVKTGANAKNTVSGPTGSESGSRYADYIKSRLEDALKVTSSYTTSKPEVVVRLTIAADGKLVRMKIERSSGDAAFELAVRRAVDLASEKFVAPPNRTTFENGFVFKPKGITNGT